MILGLLIFLIPVLNTHQDYPIRFVYTNKINTWWPASFVLRGLAVPGYTDHNFYNYVALSFWTTNQGPTDTAKVWANPVDFLSTETQFGKTDDEIRKALIQRYHENGIKVLISAFGDSNFPTSDGENAVETAKNLSEYITQYGLDGVDIDWEDTEALQNGEGEVWLITLTLTLKALLPQIIITHAPQAPYFNSGRYPKGGYQFVHKIIGHLIDFYNVQFYNQMALQFETYQQMFFQSFNQSLGSSVTELMQRNIPAEKIVIGKPASDMDIFEGNTGYIKPIELGKMLLRAYEEINWHTGVMIWQYSSDEDGTAIVAATYELIKKYTEDTKNLKEFENRPKLQIPEDILALIKARSIIEASAQTQSKEEKIKSQKQKLQQFIETNKPTIKKHSPKVNYPVKLTYINKLSEWWPPQLVFKRLGVPGYSLHNVYNYICLSFWNTRRGATDTASIWENPIKFLATQTQFGKTNEDIRKSLLKRYHDYGIKLLVSAFGSSEMPVTLGKDALTTAEELAQFVKNNSLDGVDVFWQDSKAFSSSNIGQLWIISFTMRLRQLLPDKIITHSVQAPYFHQQEYKNGGYMEVHRQIHQFIDFYNVQFYNQGSKTYETYQLLFQKSDPQKEELGTSVNELMSRGIPSNQIVIGKPATEKDAINTGYMDPTTLGWGLTLGFYQSNWFSGVALWQYDSDIEGSAIKTIIFHLEALCKSFKRCKA